MKVLVTGAAGFIGFHLSKRLLEEGCQVLGVDSLNDYYDVNLKKDRLGHLPQTSQFLFEHLDLADGDNLRSCVTSFNPEAVVNLAAQAGVRYSLENPLAYVNSNLVGFVNLMEACVRIAGLHHFVFASSSSVYGANAKVPFSENDRVDHPVSLYAATKRSNELIAHSYSHLYGTPVTGLRFFTVYGPWGRPDMGYFKFTDAILRDQPIEIYNFGDMRRDFTYIDDVVEAILRVLDSPPQRSMQQDSAGAILSNARYKIYNLGNHRPVDLFKFIEIMERALGIEAHKKFLPMQPGDVVSTYAEMDGLYDATGFQPKTPIEEGLPKFVNWYREYYATRKRSECLLRS
jgi:UDP-glucuronate 4-epimerase